MTVTLRASGLLLAILAVVATVGAILALAVSRWLPPAHAMPAAIPVDVSGAWKPAAAPLMTRFAAAVTPSSPRPEYPRPLLVRRDWRSLNGLWQFGFDDRNIGDAEGWKSGRDFAERILVPFPFESALSGIGRGSEVHERVWYRRSFEVPNEWRSGPDRRVLLNFGAVDWETTVYVNGHEVGRHHGGYTPFSLDITSALTPSGPQELVVRVYDPSERSDNGWQPRGKQKGSDGIWYTRTTGIWQTVWLEPVAAAHLTALTMTPGVAADGAGTLSVAAALPPEANGATLSLSVGGITRTAPVADGGARLTLSVPTARLWSPETPNLYDLTIRLQRDGRTLDEATSYTAFRSVGIAHGRLTLNGKPYFYRGILDQGFWPDGIYTPPSDDAIRNDVEMIRRFGFNMARKHVKVEDPRWYYWCDRLGVAVWQDMPSPTRLDLAEARNEYRSEWADVIGATQSYPCVVHWIPFNENWGNPGAFQDEIVALTRRLDPSRPITDASGWTQREKTDVLDAHNYSDSLIREGVPNPVKPKVVGEYGGVGLSVPGHVWAEGRIYVTASDARQMQELVRRRTSQLYAAPNLSGFVYTQLTDVEQELNGMLTYDRQPKADPDALARIFRGEDRTPVITTPPIRDWLVLGPIPAGVHVGATEETPESLKAMGEILSRAYLPNEAGLHPRAGETVDAGGVKRSWQAVTAEQIDFTKVLPGTHEDAAAYAVAYLDSRRDRNDAFLLLGSDDGATVWLNGRQVYRKVAIRGVEPDQDRVEGLSLHRGRNTLVVKVGQGGGGWGLTARLVTP